MSNIAINQRRKWNESGYEFRIIERVDEQFNNKHWWVLQYEDDDRKQTLDDEALRLETTLV